MANTNAPFGFQATSRNGTPHWGSQMLCQHASSDGTALYIGDLVTASNATESGLGVPVVTQAGTTSVPFGVVVGIDPIRGVAIGSENLNRSYCPASTAMYVWVLTDPTIIYAIQSDGTEASADMGKYAHITSSPTGSTSSGLSGMQLNEASVSGTIGSLQMLIVDTQHTPSNTIDAANSVVLVKLVNTLWNY